MSGLSLYHGNFVEFADREFVFHNSSRQGFAGISALELNVSCHVGIFPSSDNSDGCATIEIDAENPSDFRVTQKGSVLSVEERSTNCGTTTVTHIGNGTFINQVSGSMSFTDGRMFVNGQEVGSTQSASARQSRIKIWLPKGSDLSAVLNGLSVLASKAVFRKASVRVLGSASVGIAAKSLKLKMDGEGRSFAVLKGGDLNVSLSGAGSVTAKGDFASVDASLSGTGNLRTEGTCSGDYDADVSGVGSIAHTGTILGRRRKSVSGIGSISI